MCCYSNLGKTPFFNKTSPTPVDEAISLAWFLENIFYHAVSGIQSKLEEEFDISDHNGNQILELGFWPGRRPGWKPQCYNGSYQIGSQFFEAKSFSVLLS